MAKLRERGGLRVWGCGMGGSGSPAGRFIEGGPRSRAGIASEVKDGENPGRIPLRGGCASGGHRDDGPDPWVRPGSEG